MKPAPFAYHAPTTTSEVVELLATYGDEAKVLAGGQSLVPMLTLRLARFEHLVDLNRVEGLDHLGLEGEDLVVGAMARQRVAERSADVASASPLLTAALPQIGHFQIRNRGTIGGSLAHADPASELPAVALALDAELDILGKGGTRRVPAREFFVGTWTTAMQVDELLTSIRFPRWDPPCGFAVEEVARRHGDFAMVGVACGVKLDGTTISRAAIALFGVGPTPQRAVAAEEALVAGVTDVDEIAALAASDLDPISDVHASSAYRKLVATGLVSRALTSARARASA